MKCWKCGTDLETPERSRIPFKAICDKCLAWLHCCKNCKNYKPGLPNDCAIPGTELIADREACNFCDSFDLLGTAPKAAADPNTAAKKLFGDDPQEKKKGFKDFFKD